MSAERSTGTPNPTDNLISVLYHTLHGAETYEQYIRDAESSGDQDLAQFFRDVQQENRHRAEHAQQLLGRRLQQSKRVYTRRRVA